MDRTHMRPSDPPKEQKNQALRCKSTSRRPSHHRDPQWRLPLSRTRHPNDGLKCQLQIRLEPQNLISLILERNSVRLQP